MPKYVEKMEAAWMKELRACGGEASRCATLIETLSRMVSTTVAATSGGDEAYVDKICMGIEKYIQECALLQIKEIKRLIKD